LVRKAVESYRRRVIDQAIGQMTRQTTRAAKVIIRIANEAESESVQLRAARALFSDVITVSKYSGLEGRLTELEEQVRERDAATSAIASWSPPTYGRGATPAAMPPTTSIATGAG
jgi:hypothetical protein